MSGPVVTGKRALLIGAGRFPRAPELTDLRTPIADANDFEKELQKPNVCGFDTKRLSDPTVQQSQEALDVLFSSATSDQLVLLYFSGHGTLSDAGVLHLCVHDTRLDLLNSTAVSLTWIRNLIDQTRAAQVVIILDCCYSGAARGSLKGDVPTILKTNLGQGRGKYLVTSSTAIEPSAELDGDNNSLFTKWLIHGIASGAADANNDGFITVDELFGYVSKRVTRERPTQTPQSFGFEVRPGEVVIAKSALAPGKSVAPAAGVQLDFLNEVRRSVRAKQLIPFVGMGVYGDGPLGTFGFSRALTVEAGLRSDEPSSVATAAQSLELKSADRDDFLPRFRDALANLANEHETPEAYKLICGLNAPLLVVSATYDNLLESALMKAGKRFVVVAHILNSRDGKLDGRIVVVRPGEKPVHDVMLADALLLDKPEPPLEIDQGKDIIIYKVLGSPFIHDWLPPELGIDTVVVTENDHVRFLGRLDNQYTRVPEAFGRSFQTLRLLFLGYTLDVWHYRLVMQVFGRTKHRRPFAVRQATSPVEELCWRRVDVDLVPADPDTFARTLIGA